MSDVKDYAALRAERDPEFAEGLESGYEDFKVGVLVSEARKEAGLTLGG